MLTSQEKGPCLEDGATYLLPVQLPRRNKAENSFDNFSSETHVLGCLLGARF